MSGQGQMQELTARAAALYHSGDYQQAIQIWQELLQIDPNNQSAKEGIRMATLLLEESLAAGDSNGGDEASLPPQSPEVIGKVREGIQKVRQCLAASRYLDAMEVCQSLLQLAPRSEAVREVLEEAREAYESQPFIAEHLEIARQLFIQERYAEASAELQKIFFLNSNHEEARKLDAKVQALLGKTAPSAPPAENAAPGVPSGEPDPMATQRIPLSAITMPSEPESDTSPPESAEPAEPAPAEAMEPPVSSVPGDWEVELARLELGPGGAGEPVTPPAAKADGDSSDAEPFPLADLSEPFHPTGGPAREEAHPSAPAPQEADEGELPDLEFDSVPHELRKSPPPGRPGKRPEAMRPMPAAHRGSATPRPVVRPAPRRSSSGSKVVLTLLVLALGGGGAWWYVTGRTAAPAGGSGGADQPAPRRPLRPPSVPNPPAGGSTTGVGLSSSGSRGANSSAAQAGLAPAGAAAGVTLPGTDARLTPEETQREIARLSAEGRAEAQRGDYAEAVKLFSKVLELDPANVGIKEQMDQAAARVQEQRRLEEDLQTAKDFYVEKDYESALRKFYRLPRDRNLGEVELFIRNAWYNWAVVSMKGGNCPEAIQRLGEVLTLDPDDADALKQKEVAEHYRDRPKDRVFYAYTDRLTYRTLNQK